MSGPEHHLLAGAIGHPPYAKTAPPVGGTKAVFTKMQRGPFTLYKNQADGYFQIRYGEHWLPGVYAAEYVAMFACGMYCGLGGDTTAIARLWYDLKKTQPALSCDDLQTLMGADS